MKMGFSGEDFERRSVSVVQAFVVGDCLKVGVNSVTTQIPLMRLTRVVLRYHFLSHPETGRTHDSVCNRPAAQQSPSMEALWKR